MAASYNGIPLPSSGTKITYENGKLVIPDNPIIPFIEGDGTGRDIWKASVRVFDAAVEKAYDGKRRVAWYEVFAGEKAMDRFKTWLPDETVDAFRELRVGIKGPLTTPVGGGIRSLNVALRQILDLYACVRPVKYYQGIPSPVKHPERMNIVIFRENTEDVYAGIEWKQGTPEAKKLIDFLNNKMLAGTNKRIREDSGVGIKPISITGTKRLVRMAIEYALENNRKSVTLVHKGNIQKFTEGAFREWGYEVGDAGIPRPGHHRARELDHRQQGQAIPALPSKRTPRWSSPDWNSRPQEFRADALQGSEGRDRQPSTPRTATAQWKSKLMINDRIADSIFQQIVTRPDEYAVLATPNLNGDYISDAAAAQVGGLGIAPGANIGDEHAIFEATHGTAPKYADKDVINPGSVMLSGVMMFDFMGWNEAARLIEESHGAHHPAEEGHLRLRAHAGRRDQGQDQRVCDPHDPEHGQLAALSARDSWQAFIRGADC